CAGTFRVIPTPLSGTFYDVAVYPQSKRVVGDLDQLAHRVTDLGDGGFTEGFCSGVVFTSAALWPPTGRFYVADTNNLCYPGTASYHLDFWSTDYNNNANSTTLHALSLVRSNLGYAAGEGGAKLFMFDGSGWKEDVNGPGFTVSGLKAFSSTDIYAVGASSSV